MFFKPGISLVCFLLLLGVACDSKSSAGQNPAPEGNASQAVASTTKPTEPEGEEKSEASPVSSAASLDACALIEKSEIASVQGAEVQEARPTSQKYGHLDVSQCYYTAVSADGSKNLSVYVQVIRPDPKTAGRDALKKFWEERFGRKRREEGDERGEEEEEERINPPLRVSGLGDQAFWLGSSRGGALYVLRKGRVVRVTAAGSGDARDDIRRSKALAKKALARLP